MFPKEDKRWIRSGVSFFFSSLYPDDSREKTAGEADVSTLLVLVVLVLGGRNAGPAAVAAAEVIAAWLNVNEECNEEEGESNECRDLE